LLGLRLLLFALRKGRSAALTRRAIVPGAVMLAVSAMVTGVAFTVARLAQPGSYGGSFLTSAGLALDDTTQRNLEILALRGGLVVPLFLVGLLFDVVRWRQLSSHSQAWLAGAMVVCLVVVPQLVLYRRFGGFAIDRYILPAGIGLTAGVAAGT